MSASSQHKSAAVEWWPQLLILDFMSYALFCRFLSYNKLSGSLMTEIGKLSALAAM
jgi:hypothetical protein